MFQINPYTGDLGGPGQNWQGAARTGIGGEADLRLRIKRSGMDLSLRRVESEKGVDMYNQANEKWLSLDGLSSTTDSPFSGETTSDGNMFTSWIGNQSFERTESPDVGLPKEMLFNDDSLVSVVAYSVLFVIAALGNMTVFLTLFRNRHRKSRVNLFIMHLSIADLIVTFVMLPIEIGWHLTVSWKAGDIGCRLLMFLRAFGFYLSSFVLIAISLDRYFAILHPLSLTDAGKRGKIMLIFSWVFSVIASTPQVSASIVVLFFDTKFSPDNDILNKQLFSVAKISTLRQG